MVEARGVSRDKSDFGGCDRGGCDGGEVLATAWHELLARYHRTTCALDRALLADHGLTVSDFEVLQQLHAALGGDGRVRLHELGEQVHLSQSALSRLVTRLERAGLVARYVCEDDRRSAWTELTSLGERRYLEARPTHRAILRQLDRAERETVVALAGASH